MFGVGHLPELLVMGAILLVVLRIVYGLISGLRSAPPGHGAATLQAQLAQKDAMIARQAEEIGALREQIRALEARAASSSRPSGTP